MLLIIMLWCYSKESRTSLHTVSFSHDCVSLLISALGQVSDSNCIPIKLGCQGHQPYLTVKRICTYKCQVSKEQQILLSVHLGLEKVILKVLPEVWTAGEGSLVCLEDCSHPCSLPTQTTATLPGLLYTLGKGPTFVQEWEWRDRTHRWKQHRVSECMKGEKKIPGVVLSSMSEWETWVRSLGQEGPLEKEVATHSNILAWRIPWTEESGGLQSMGLQRVGHDWVSDLTLFKKKKADHISRISK